MFERPEYDGVGLLVLMWRLGLLGPVVDTLSEGEGRLEGLLWPCWAAGNDEQVPTFDLAAWDSDGGGESEKEGDGDEEWTFAVDLVGADAAKGEQQGDDEDLNELMASDECEEEHEGEGDEEGHEQKPGDQVEGVWAEGTASSTPLGPYEQLLLRARVLAGLLEQGPAEEWEFFCEHVPVSSASSLLEVGDMLKATTSGAVLPMATWRPPGQQSDEDDDQDTDGQKITDEKRLQADLATKARDDTGEKAEGKFDEKEGEYDTQGKGVLWTSSIAMVALTLFFGVVEQSAST